MNSASSETTNTDNEKATIELTGGMEIGGYIRGNIPVGDNVDVVPVVRFSTYSFSVEETPFSGDKIEYGDYSNMELTAGCAAKVAVLDDGFVSVGLAVDMDTENDEIDTTDKIKETDLTLPEVSVAAEIPATKWLKVRGGITKRFGTETTDEEGNEEVVTFTESDAFFAMLGMGIEYKNFGFDITVSDNHIFEGAYILSGQAMNLAGITATGTFTW